MALPHPRVCHTGDVPERCTCGAHLPPDALFCHKCGKPQREYLAPVEVETPPPLPPPDVAPEPPPIGFHNGLAVRIALFVGILSIVVSAVLGVAVPRASLIWPVVAGFVAVLLYERRTGQRLSIRSGAHLGWICGVFVFVIVTIMLTMFAVALSDPTAVSALREQWKTVGKSPAELDQMIQIFHNPSTITGALLMVFLLFTILPAFGGAVGAKLLDRD